MKQAKNPSEVCSDYDEPADPVRAGLRLGDLLTLSQRWYEDFCAHDRKFTPADRLQDRWIDVIGKIPHAFDAWACAFLLWGRHVLPDVIADLWDGEVEYYFDA